MRKKKDEAAPEVIESHTSEPEVTAPEAVEPEVAPEEVVAPDETVAPSIVVTPDESIVVIEPTPSLAIFQGIDPDAQLHFGGIAFPSATEPDDITDEERVMISNWRYANPQHPAEAEWEFLQSIRDSE